MIASRLSSPGGVINYSVSKAKYQFTASPAKNYAFQWAELFSPNFNGEISYGDYSYTVVDVQNWNINSFSQSNSSEYEIDPTQNPSKYGYYFLAPAPQINAVAGTSGNGGYYPGTDQSVNTAYLDTNQMGSTGASVTYDADPNSNSVGGGDIFYISNNYLPGATYTLSWNNDSSFEVWAYYYYGGWQQISSGEPLDGSYYGLEGMPTEYTVVATGDAQSGEQTDITLSMSGVNLGNCLFTYTNNPDLSIPLDEASGSRYRKIALNGLPMGDEKPQESAENDQEKEETYVDALTLGLRHSTTDIYMPVSGSDFSVSARRDFRSQVWNNRSGLTPHEQPDLPFGMCWSSNLAPNIKLIQTNDPSNTTEPDQAIVTDETGAVHTFLSLV